MILGGLGANVSFSADNHAGTEKTRLGIVKDGKWEQLTDYFQPQRLMTENQINNFGGKENLIDATINNLEAVYQKIILALRGMSLHVPEGKIVALLGSNGAGKSTTLKAISGLLSWRQRTNNRWNNYISR